VEAAVFLSVDLLGAFMYVQLGNIRNNLRNQTSACDVQPLQDSFSGMAIYQALYSFSPARLYSSPIILDQVHESIRIKELTPTFQKMRGLSTNWMLVKFLVFWHC